tara:strand:+ start:232 stop:489 length:258 start_codon:yes stop_codon:yes gene_type:complete
MMTTTNKIQNGSLYFNTSTNRVERAIGSINGQRLWTQYHKNPLNATPVKLLRLASDNEVEGYKTETPVKLPPLPKLPTSYESNRI